MKPPRASPIDYKGSLLMASPRILNQKKKSIQRIRNETHHVAGREIKPQYCLYRAKAKQTLAN